MIANGNPNIAGFVGHADDFPANATAQQIVDRFRLDDYPGTGFAADHPYVVIRTKATLPVADNIKIPRSTGSDGYKVGNPTNTVDYDGAYPYTGDGFAASRDGHLTAEYRMQSTTVMDAGEELGVPNTVMEFRAADGSPLHLAVDNPNLPPGFPTEYAVDGFLPSDWRLEEIAAGQYRWIPCPE